MTQKVLFLCTTSLLELICMSVKVLVMGDVLAGERGIFRRSKVEFWKDISIWACALECTRHSHITWLELFSSRDLVSESVDAHCCGAILVRFCIPPSPMNIYEHEICLDETEADLCRGRKILPMQGSGVTCAKWSWAPKLGAKSHRPLSIYPWHSIRTIFPSTRGRS